MAIEITLLPYNEDGSGDNLYYAVGTLTFSGDYVVGGDTVDFTTVADKTAKHAHHPGLRRQPKRRLRILRGRRGNRAEQLEVESFHRRRHGTHRRSLFHNFRGHRRGATHHHRPQAAVGACRLFAYDVKGALVEKLLGVGFSTSSKASIFPHILMNQRDLASLCVQICYDLTAGAIGFTRVRRAGMAVSIRLFG